MTPSVNNSVNCNPYKVGFGKEDSTLAYGTINVLLRFTFRCSSHRSWIIFRVLFEFLLIDVAILSAYPLADPLSLFISLYLLLKIITFVIGLRPGTTFLCDYSLNEATCFSRFYPLAHNATFLFEVFW